MVALTNRRRHQILILSCIYYRLGENIIDDFTFDKWSRELVELQFKYEEESKACRYYKDFKSFDGTTGFDLPIHITQVIARAKKVLWASNQYK